MILQNFVETTENRESFCNFENEDARGVLVCWSKSGFFFGVNFFDQGRTCENFDFFGGFY